MTHREPDHRAEKKVDGGEIQRASGEALGHGFTIAAAIGLFLWAGDRLDGVLGTSPLFALTGMLVGAAAGFYRLYAHLMVDRQSSDREDDDAE